MQIKPWLILIIKIYVAASIVVLAVLSPPALSVIPWLFLAWYLVVWKWSNQPLLTFFTEYFTFFFLAVLFAPALGTLFSLLALPVIVLIHTAVEGYAETSDYFPSSRTRRPTSFGITVLVLPAVVLITGLLLRNPALMLGSTVMLLYFGILLSVSIRKLTFKPIREIVLDHRIVAGSRETVRFEMEVMTKAGELLFLKPLDNWTEVSSEVLSLKDGKGTGEVTIEPLLSGPTSVRLKAYVIGRWGLVQVSFYLEPIRLHVIARATYADWLAKRYLENQGAGSLPLISNIEALKPMYGLRRGIEYYGNQLYQPGDSLKNIDWKHSLQYNELIVKEFAEFHGRPAVILTNLAVGNAEEADKLAYSIIVTALSLARETIPVALAAYDNERIVLTTRALEGDDLVARALELTKEIVTLPNPVRYLTPPDVLRLRANLSRIRFVKSPAAQKLAQLMAIEYQGIKDTAAGNPVTRALAEVSGKTDAESNIVIISNRNHDAEALAMGSFDLSRRGNTVMDIMVSSGNRTRLNRSAG